MIKVLFLFSLLSVVPNVWAQDLDISLFDDVPNLGRSAPPLDSLRLTPPPAPDIRIDLDNSQDRPPQQAPAETPSQDLPPLPSTHIDLSGTSPAPVVPAPIPERQEPPRPLHNVSSFDIHGFYLGSSLSEVLHQAKQHGYRVTLTQESVPLFYATDYAHQCHEKGIIIPDKVKQCIKDYACHQKTRYISEVKLSRKNETFHLYFTSRATDNLLYKIIYTNKGDNSLNFTRINKAKKQLRQTEFWHAVFDKFGYPDDQKLYIWGDPAKAYMKAYMTGSNYDGFIIMEDIQLSNEDYFEAQDVESERPVRNHFSF